MRGRLYRSFRKDLATARIDLLADTLKVLLVGAEYVFDPGHQRRSDVRGEAQGRGYQEGGRELTGKVIEFDAEDVMVLRADGLLWAPATVAAVGAVLYKSRGREPFDDELIEWFPFDEPRGVLNGALRIDWAGGVVLRSSERAEE